MPRPCSSALGRRRLYNQLRESTHLRVLLAKPLFEGALKQGNALSSPTALSASSRVGRCFWEQAVNSNFPYKAKIPMLRSLFLEMAKRPALRNARRLQSWAEPLPDLRETCKSGLSPSSPRNPVRGTQLFGEHRDKPDNGRTENHKEVKSAKFWLPRRFFGS